MNNQTLPLALASLLVKKGILKEGEIIGAMDQMEAEMYRANPALMQLERRLRGDVQGFLELEKEEREKKEKKGP